MAAAAETDPNRFHELIRELDVQRRSAEMTRLREIVTSTFVLFAEYSFAHLPAVALEYSWTLFFLSFSSSIW